MWPRPEVSAGPFLESPKLPPTPAGPYSTLLNLLLNHPETAQKSQISSRKVVFSDRIARQAFPGKPQLPPTPAGSYSTLLKLLLNHLIRLPAFWNKCQISKYPNIWAQNPCTVAQNLQDAAAEGGRHGFCPRWEQQAWLSGSFTLNSLHLPAIETLSDNCVSLASPPACYWNPLR